MGPGLAILLELGFVEGELACAGIDRLLQRLDVETLRLGVVSIRSR
jgi:hypothetical protein